VSTVVRACPPEDRGGTGGYRDLPAILADPTHPERDERIEWRGRPFDPELCDRDEFTSNLRLATFDDRTEQRRVHARFDAWAARPSASDTSKVATRTSSWPGRAVVEATTAVQLARC
jgi:hypothetical protein